MSPRERLPRWPFRTHLMRARLWLFGWINLESHRELKQLLKENQRLRSAEIVSR